jgi:hypothetical protein
MASFVKYQNFVEDLGNAVHDLVGTQHTLKVALTNTAPNVATHAVFADITEISAGSGYTAGGEDTQNATSRSGGTTSVTGVDVVWTASGGTIGPFRYVVLYNDTTSDNLIGYWDYGSSVTLQIGETFTTDFGASMFTVA